MREAIWKPIEERLTLTSASLKQRVGARLAYSPPTGSPVSRRHRPPAATHTRRLHPPPTPAACTPRPGGHLGFHFNDFFYPLIQACAYYGLTESGLVDWEKNSELMTNVIGKSCSSYFTLLKASFS